MQWLPGYTKDQLDDAQARYGLRFPPDLVDLLRERSLDERYDWAAECPFIRKMLNWPFDLLQFDVEEGGLWWRGWGERPATKEARDEVLKSALAQAPTLIPLHGHRFLPETPAEAGNPVFSMHGFDTVYYGETLSAYLENEFASGWTQPIIEPRRIPFWSDLVDRFPDAYDCCDRSAAERGPADEAAT